MTWSANATVTEHLASAAGPYVEGRSYSIPAQNMPHIGFCPMCGARLESGYESGPLSEGAKGGYGLISVSRHASYRCPGCLWWGLRDWGYDAECHAFVGSDTLLAGSVRELDVAAASGPGQALEKLFASPAGREDLTRLAPDALTSLLGEHLRRECGPCEVLHVGPTPREGKRAFEVFVHRAESESLFRLVRQPGNASPVRIVRRIHGVIVEDDELTGLVTTDCLGRDGGLATMARFRLVDRPAALALLRGLPDLTVAEAARGWLTGEGDESGSGWLPGGFSEDLAPDAG